ncbi:PAS domain-domain-containing protein [Catenaria anguillulae PL171]|uniref:PAS domain-domain-containing protein n=1 Tax=Catenaria anguillulae PL171 TaxID=765915 RepID=A0A1Y2HI25_9FUNG|nr:PAS domain-domain-containing protein [Catenaria anguillulae PL171]
MAAAAAAGFLPQQSSSRAPPPAIPHSLPPVANLPPSSASRTRAPLSGGGALAHQRALSPPAVPPGAPNPRTTVPGLYSATGFDIMGVLAKVATRANPQVSIGPVDMSCSFVVSDARKPDQPILYVSETFERLTGYSSADCVGRNCRFLQSPDGLVNEGSHRRYTDNATVAQLKTELMAKRECQFTLINYRKGGEPFINLITIIPISWERDDEVSYFVGFQVDLVEQPNAIMQRMRDGTYVVNYQVAEAPVAVPRMVGVGAANDDRGTGPTGGGVEGQSTTLTGHFAMDVTDLVGVRDPTEAANLFYRALVDQVDFIHVLSLRGVLLYVSQDCQRVLEYSEAELVGRSLSEFCHPGDLVSVMRELKESSNGVHPVNMVYRIRRKNSGYMWMEVSGKCTQGEKAKGKKFVVLTGREKPVVRVHRNDIVRAGGVNDVDMWAKLALEGLFLHVSTDAQALVGFTATELVGKSLLDLVHIDDLAQLRRALDLVRQANVVTLPHRIKNKKGEYLQVMSAFVPGNSATAGDVRFALHRCTDVVDARQVAQGLQAFAANEVVEDTDDLFDVLSPVRCTSWQYELHQLRLQNRRLRAEIEEMDASVRGKKRRGGNKDASANSSAAAAAAANGGGS